MFTLRSAAVAAMLIVAFCYCSDGIAQGGRGSGSGSGNGEVEILYKGDQSLGVCNCTDCKCAHCPDDCGLHDAKADKWSMSKADTAYHVKATTATLKKAKAKKTTTRSARSSGCAGGSCAGASGCSGSSCSGEYQETQNYQAARPRRVRLFFGGGLFGGGSRCANGQCN